MRSFKRNLLAGAIAFAVSAPAAAQFTGAYFFGDSVTDSGNFKPVLPAGTGKIHDQSGSGLVRGVRAALRLDRNAVHAGRNELCLRRRAGHGSAGRARCPAYPASPCRLPRR